MDKIMSLTRGYKALELAIFSEKDGKGFIAWYNSV